MALTETDTQLRPQPSQAVPVREEEGHGVVQPLLAERRDEWHCNNRRF